MAEIKSTLELVLERTKHLVMSDDEKKQMELDEHLEKLPGQVQKYLDGLIDVDDLKRVIDGIPASCREAAIRRLIRLLLERLKLSTVKRVIRALREFAASEERERLGAIESLYEEYEAKRIEMGKRIFDRISQKLSEMSISGDGYEIIPERSPEYREFQDNFERLFSGEKDKWLACLNE